MGDNAIAFGVGSPVDFPQQQPAALFGIGAFSLALNGLQMLGMENQHGMKRANSTVSGSSGDLSDSADEESNAAHFRITILSQQLTHLAGFLRWL